MTKKKRVTARDPVTKYAQQVAYGRKPMGKYVTKACERHLEDLETASERGLYFDKEDVEFVIDFFKLLKHSKGKWAGESFELSDWQIFIVGSLFGWKREDGTRRFRMAYVEIPRKNGKSTLAAGVALCCLAFDGEMGAEVYTAATKKDQARIVFDECKRMVNASPDLREFIGVHKYTLFMSETHSKLEPLSSDAQTLDGLNSHCNIVDELHAHKTRELVDVLETGMGARSQPLQLEITTAGSNVYSVCYERRTYGVNMLDRIYDDDQFFAYIACIDEGDDWSDEENWYKANPNLGISVYPDYLQTLCKKAKNMPSFQNTFRRLHLNEWTGAEKRWVDADLWRGGAQELDLESLKGRECFAGLDLASTTDISALVLFFPDEDNQGGIALPFFWIPEDTMYERIKSDRVPYDVWKNQNFIYTTPGNVTDYNFIRAKINELRELYNIKEIAYDKWNSSQLVNDLVDDGANMIGFRQGFGSFAAPMREVERMIHSKRLNHLNNPVLAWMVSNTVIKEDESGNMKPDKKKSTQRIDGVVSTVMAIGLNLADRDEEETNFYEDNEMVIV